jgi:D-alanyl-lipoteichoic acid acyltransferase DltB (MBOAT superfamily)
MGPVLFNSPLYGVFLVGAYAVFWLLRKARLARAVFLTIASYGFYFYGTYDTSLKQKVPLGPFWWSVLCLGVIFVGSSLDYWIGRALASVERVAARRALLLTSVVYYLGVLSIFKYFNFFVDNVVELARLAHLDMKPAHLRLVLPFGISFFTFETMSYTIDVYRREIEPCRRYLDYLLFVCYFPHLVAGPIVRPRQMLPQLAREPVVDAKQQSEGLWMIIFGLAKKIMIGDVLAANIVNRVFDNPSGYKSLEVLVAVYAYAIEIYCDFSGYTDVALGSAKLFGYELPQNFDAPYTSTNIQDFWRRWHMSLSSWLRDYLYIPLGGNRRGTFNTYRNLMLTMLLGGLWHGASWNFVLWGGLHGAALVVTQLYHKHVSAAPPRGFGRVVSTLATFHFVCFCWIFFRAPSFGHAVLVLQKIASFTKGAANVSPTVLATLALGAVTHFVPEAWIEKVRAPFVRSPALVQGIVLVIAAYAIHFAAGAQPEPFVYGQF